MGEIADALRRVRTGVSRSPLGPSLEPVPAVAPPARVAPSHPARPTKPSRRVSSMAPGNAAVILDGPHAETCRHVALRLRSALQERNAKSVAVVSAERSDGKTTVACDLAIALATLVSERDVALVDLDLRRPSLASSLALRAKIGIEEVLAGRASLDQARIAVEDPQIDVLTAVVPQRDAHKLLLRPETAALIEELERRYRYVIVDTPPAPLVPDANLLLRHVDACVPVVRAGKTRMRSIRKLVHCLPANQMLGWILNGERSAHFAYQDYYYYGEGPQEPDRTVPRGATR